MLWDFETRVAAREGAPHAQAVTCLAWSRCGRYVATGARESRAALWDVARGEVVRAINPLRTLRQPSALWSSFLARSCRKGFLPLLSVDTN